MKKLFLLLAIVSTTFSAYSTVVYRVVQDGANGNFDWTCVDAYDHFIIYCEASTVCKTCPLSVNATSCERGGVFDNTDYLAMETLFTHADTKIAEGDDSGTETRVFQVSGESEPRLYKVTWTFDGTSHEQKWEEL
jgi:hypothetical protein